MSEKARVIAGTFRSMLPGLVVGGIVAALPGALGEVVAKLLVCLAAGAIVSTAASLWWTSRHLSSIRSSAAEMTQALGRIQASEARCELWRARTIATHRQARDHFATLGASEIVALYDRLIADMEGTCAPGGDA